MSRMPAYTTCFASARARTVNAPKPLDAPVTRITFWFDMSDHSSVHIDDLAVDPPRGSGEESNCLGDICRFAKAFQRRCRLRTVDDVLRLAVEVQRRRG